MIVNFEYPLLNCKSISVIPRIIDIHNIHNCYMYIHDIFMDTTLAWQWARDWGALFSTIYVLGGHLLSGWK